MSIEIHQFYMPLFVACYVAIGAFVGTICECFVPFEKSPGACFCGLFWPLVFPFLVGIGLGFAVRWSARVAYRWLTAEPKPRPLPSASDLKTWRESA